MDLGLLGFAAIVSVPLFAIIYGMFHFLNKQLRTVRAKEQAFVKTRQEQKLDWLTNRAEAQEQTLENSRRELVTAFEDLDRTRGEYGRRIDNLEAVVVGEVGKAVGPPELATRPHEVADTSTNESSRPNKATKSRNRRRAARLAHRFDK